ncbi:unnamed protein product (macronuclear) [Paramecium tetraurelia]|uniref:Uncharacterized protein n=1 Tax=Paramecium tetraurelia TaxID=5888 RepID=A0C6D9_PARTE|nr:uncharacterized protein GSPATT00035485001 [Paramecium tetraurelia]CAK66356.1 unnamed protein product [Paramecium tetraurelia]|eukprot:XP_001433753.1 hypothetical protein (macronuclear) [Paramecium tetraurelia strain d4-2]
MFYYSSPNNMNYHHLVLEVALKQNTTLILTSECPSHFQSCLLKQGIKMDDLIKQQKLQIIDLFTQNTLWQEEELPLTETAPKLWSDPQPYQKDLSNYLLSQVKQKVVILENLSFFEIMCNERKLKPLKIIEELLTKCDQLHIFGSKQPLSQESVSLINFIIKHSISVTNLLPNQSGFSKDIDGQMIVETRHDGGICFEKSIYSLDQNKVNYLSALKMI